MQNYDMSDNYRVNNDVLIPRSIIKKAPFANPVKEKRLEEAAKDFFSYQ